MFDYKWWRKPLLFVFHFNEVFFFLCCVLCDNLSTTTKKYTHNFFLNINSTMFTLGRFHGKKKNNSIELLSQTGFVKPRIRFFFYKRFQSIAPIAVMERKQSHRSNKRGFYGFYGIIMISCWFHFTWFIVHISYRTQVDEQQSHQKLTHSQEAYHW